MGLVNRRPLQRESRPVPVCLHNSVPVERQTECSNDLKGVSHLNDALLGGMRHIVVAPGAPARSVDLWDSAAPAFASGVAHSALYLIFASQPFTMFDKELLVGEERPTVSVPFLRE